GGEGADAFSRVFLVPGMHHCAGGDGPVSFDALTPLVDWVEQGTAPEVMEAAVPGGEAADARPLCAWPAYAQPEGDGFACAE
ncbi:MAG: tannase/feruloyl esterase family alpha/beta hydrolase, partial [Paracoccus sp. (in: a-proteobacteria)]|nr:tannase/feruloyl esterase family alpha/beta hydrolase [Paracoccus sp. (in: a-proteobacteria)]